MEPAVLTDPNVYPDDDVIYSHLGKTRTLWDNLFNHIQSNYSTVNKEWRYYNDGKSWLLKVTQKASTVCWISIFQDGFRMTCYLPLRAESSIHSSDLPADLKEQFSSGPSYGKIRGITIVFKDESDVQAAEKLFKFKMGFK